MRISLKEARLRAGYTQQQVAVRIGTSQQTVSKHETEKTTPQHFSILRGYEELFGVPADKLFPDIFNVAR